MIKEDSAVALASEDFHRARAREIVSRILSVFTGRKDELLSFAAVKDILRPSSESYRGIRAVPLELIVGSEGRYRDFTRSFLPRHRHMRGRWMSIGAARYRDVNLPPVRLYEIGGVYFIRDGNHRVAVARQHRVEFIDAEITALDTYFRASPDMTHESLVAAVIEYERQRFVSATGIDDLLRGVDIQFTSPGRYDLLLSQIQEQRRRLSGGNGQASMEDAVRLWYDSAYRPLVDLVVRERLLSAFPGRTAADLYAWIVQHWELLKSKYGAHYPIVDAVRDFAGKYRRPWLHRILDRLRGRRAPVGEDGKGP
jgi:hypothetical protein